MIRGAAAGRAATIVVLGLASALVVGCGTTATDPRPRSVPTAGAATAAAAPASTASPTASTTPSSARTSAPAAAGTSAPPRARIVRNGCAHNTAPRAVRVSLRRQHLWMCSGQHVVRDTPITSGVVGQYTSTPTGHYVIQGVQRDTTLTLISGASFAVKYWIPFDGPLFGFHDSSWQHFPYGSPLYRTRGSHGCVHMPLKAIAFLARWSSAGTTQVLIHA